MFAANNGPPIPILVSKFEDFVRDRRFFFGRISNFFGFPEIRVPSLHWQSTAAMRNFRTGRIGEWRDVLTTGQSEYSKIALSRWRSTLGGDLTLALGRPAKSSPLHGDEIRSFLATPQVPATLEPP
jgi:hypothetical protein